MALKGKYMQTVRAIMLICAGLIGASLSIVCFIALLPLLPFIRYLAGACLAFGACYIIAVGMIDLRRRWLHSSIVPLAEYGSYHTRRLELLHIPQLALPAPVTVTEEKEAEGKPEVDEWRILELWGKGMSFEDIATACNTTYYRVQKITSTWKKKLAKAYGTSGTVVDQSQGD